ncbi:MAG TPA: hypothetical protein VE439_08310 [Anaerolineae bacterium]|jgi:hypothetical protein|nr:hypothetical protein [Anaerolineae bacterium]
MVFKRAMLFMLFALLIFAVACSSASNAKLSQEEVNKSIIEVSKHYGESNPLISLKETETERDFKPMYLVQLKGKFTKGNLHATNLSFSMLADGTYTWAIRGSDDNNQTIWEDDER